jgi:hypothetical protein
VPAGLALALAFRASAVVPHGGRASSGAVSSLLPPRPPAGDVPEPGPVRVDALPMPACWTCPEGSDGRETPRTATFVMDLDVLAPLGTGSDNAAEWLAAFARGGPRADDALEARRRRVPAVLGLVGGGGGVPARVLPADDPLLREAEPWIDQARCRFHPDVWPIDAGSPRQPNLLLALTLAKSWIARADAAPDPAEASRDARRAIRLGRLLLQDDVAIPQDLVGRACVALGAGALHRRAREAGDLPLALATALVLSEHDGVRAVTALRTGVLQAVAPAAPGPLGGDRVQASDADVDAVIALTHETVERRFRIAAMRAVRLAELGGTPEQRERARAALDALELDPDPLVAAAARGVSSSPAETQEPGP